MSGKVFDPVKIEKMAGWYSWRNPTRAAQDAAKADYIATHATARARIARRARRA